jgi:hypothetical protein
LKNINYGLDILMLRINKNCKNISLIFSGKHFYTSIVHQITLFKIREAWFVAYILWEPHPPLVNFGVPSVYSHNRQEDIGYCIQYQRHYGPACRGWQGGTAGLTNAYNESGL